MEEEEEEEEVQQFVTYSHQNKRARNIFHVAAPTALPFYILQKLTLIKVAQFSHITTTYHTSGP
jgi:hypothetical protein